MNTPDPSLFSGLKLDADRYDRISRKRGPARRYGIFFTPRSGSSWLTEIATKATGLGEPGEFFNPNFVPNIARAFAVDTLDRYVTVLQRRKCLQGVFSFEVTYFQLMRVFETEETFLSFFPADLPYFYLTRDDIVLQAVSLAKAVQTDLYHAVRRTETEIAEADRAFGYDPKAIRGWLAHIQMMEIRFAQFFARHGLQPIRLSYERITAAGADATLQLLAEGAGLPVPVPTGAEILHRKIGTGKNADFARRFRRENAAICDEIDRHRHSPDAPPLAERPAQS